MNFKTKTITILAAAFLLIMLSAIFTASFFKFNNELQLTKKEIIGIDSIIKQEGLLYRVQNLRGISQIDKHLIKSSEQEEIFSNLKELKNKKIDKELSVLENIGKTSDSYTIYFNCYTKIIQELKLLNFETTDSSGLLFESDRDLHFLIIASFSDIPKATEEIAKVRGIGSALLAKHDNGSISNMEKHIYTYQNNISNIQNYIQKVNLHEARKIDAQINNINAHNYFINSIVSNIKNSNLSPQEFFSETSLIIKDLHNIFILSSDILIKKLTQREDTLSNTIFLGFIIYAFISFILIVGTYIFYLKQNSYQKGLAQKREKEKFINKLRSDLEDAKNLKDICDMSLFSIIKVLGAINGSLYLYDKRSSKLYLGSVYGIDKKSLKHTLNKHDNIISENISEKKINIQTINNTVDLGNIDVVCNKLVTIPLIDFEQNIGTIQLSFAENSKRLNTEFIDEISAFMSSFIHEAQNNEETTSYLNLIDENILMSKTDIKGNIKEVSQQLCTLSQYTKEELIGQNHRILRHPDTPAELFKDLWGTITKGKVWRGELKNKKKDGGYYWIQSLITPDYDLNNNIIGYTAIRADITDKKLVEEIAITDGLTNLHNRRHFDSIFPDELEITYRTNSILVFALIDIDNFKIYNDTYGHQEGDHTLKMVASALKRTMNRVNDHTFRLGGEEFGLLYFVEDEDDAYKIADEARENVEALKIEHSGNTASKFVTISSGIYIVRANEEKKSADEIYKQCDDGLYKAKESGRNKVVSSN
ncbi:sensor domain-containing diguanylate cyclase [Sulfurimonas sp.]